MAKKTKLVKLANGTVVRLTIGEINAIKAFVKMNGRKGQGNTGVQYNPGNIKYTTVNNLVEKGVMERYGMGLVRFPDGVLDITVTEN